MGLPNPFVASRGPVGVETLANPALQNSWAASAGAGTALRIRRIGKAVYLEGLLGGGTLNSIAFTLPAGWRPDPDTLLRFAKTYLDATVGQVTIAPTGDVSITGAGNFVALDGITFLIP